MDLFYRAKRKFSDMLHSSEYTIKSQLYPGALVIFDNRRVLHSRSAIAVEDGPRWLQGCYIDRDGLMYLYERLRRHLNKAVPAWRNLREATAKDFDDMGEAYDTHVSSKTMTNLFALLESQKDAYLGAPVSLYEHNLQTASRALRAGLDDETVVVSLFHDIFETLAVKNHGELAASMLSPWISPRSQWLLAHHEIFQGHYYFEYYGMDKNTRDMFKNSPYYDWTVEWCESYDQASFDKDYPTLPLDAFLPSVERVLSRTPYWWNPTHPKAGAVSAAPSNLSNDKAGGTEPVHLIANDASAPSGSRSVGTTDSLSVEASFNCPDTWTCYG
jgi:predicted HD phosphohydrolase